MSFEACLCTNCTATYGGCWIASWFGPKYRSYTELRACCAGKVSSKHSQISCGMPRLGCPCVFHWSGERRLLGYILRCRYSNIEFSQPISFGCPLLPLQHCRSHWLVHQRKRPKEIKTVQSKTIACMLSL